MNTELDAKADALRQEIERNAEVARLILNNDRDGVMKWAKGALLRYGDPSPRFIAESEEIDTVRAENAALRTSHAALVRALEAFMALDPTFSTICDAHLDEAATESPMGAAVKLARAALSAAKEV